MVEWVTGPRDWPPANLRHKRYDLTAGEGSTPAKTLEDVQRKIAQNPFNLATVVHEATHQIAFNTGKRAEGPIRDRSGVD